MNNFLFGLIVLCLSFANPVTENKLTEKPIRIEKDLFENHGHIKAYWLGYLQSAKTNKSISNVPMFIYRNTQSEYAKIICIPAQPMDWNAKFKGKSVTQKTSITKTLTQGIINHAFGEKQFAIYAFFQQNNDKKIIQVDKNNNLAVFPVTIYIYKNVGTKWNPVAQKTVANRIAYQQLQYDVASASLYDKSI